jgi:hypothetical protein
MKQIFYIALFINVVFIFQGFAQKSGTAEREVEFQQHRSYFENNSSNLKGNVSYLVFTDEKNFDRVFGSAATMGDNSFCLITRLIPNWLLQQSSAEISSDV